MPMQSCVSVVVFPIRQAKLRGHYREPMAQKAETIYYLVLIEKVCHPWPNGFAVFSHLSPHRAPASRGQAVNLFLAAAPAISTASA